MKYITLFLLFTAQISFAQSKSLTKVIDNIDYQRDTLQAVYDWVTDNIKYDAGKLKQMENGVNLYDKGNYKNIDEYRAASLEQVIRKKKGVCEDYTLLFAAIMDELGYTTQTISGLTKDNKGKVNKRISHSWIAVKVGDTWKLIDPTWGAGYLNENKKFVKLYKAEWFDVDPQVMIETHFPFDPIWQLSENPVTYNEYKAGKTTGSFEEEFDYKQMIATHFQKEKKEQLVDELERSEQFGGTIKPIKKYRKHLQNQITGNEMKDKTRDLNQIAADCRASAMTLNDYFKAKSQRFKGSKWTVEYAISTLTDVKVQLEDSIEAFSNPGVKNVQAKRAYKKNASQSKQMLQRVNKELNYLNGI